DNRRERLLMRHLVLVAYIAFRAALAPTGLISFVSTVRGLFFFFKQKTAYEVGLGIPAEPLFRSMVRSYYPSECHADYFDFERIEALKPAIEACGISTLSQSPMLGFHKQMDNRIKLLEEILSFRMQGVEFDNGDMYVDG